MHSLSCYTSARRRAAVEHVSLVALNLEGILDCSRGRVDRKWNFVLLCYVVYLHAVIESHSCLATVGSVLELVPRNVR